MRPRGYAGWRWVSGGTWQLGKCGGRGAIVGNVIDNGVFAGNRSDAVTVGGASSGTGAFRQAGTGTTIFTATNIYSGGTTIAAGTLSSSW